MRSNKKTNHRHILILSSLWYARGTFCVSIQMFTQRSERERIAMRLVGPGSHSILLGLSSDCLRTSFGHDQCWGHYWPNVDRIILGQILVEIWSEFGRDLSGIRTRYEAGPNSSLLFSAKNLNKKRLVDAMETVKVGDKYKKGRVIVKMIRPQLIL